jgi:GTP cyclohydrolase I
MAPKSKPGIDKDRIASLIRQLLEEIGEDPEREGLRSTPRRVAEVWATLMRGYRQNAKAVINGALFESEVNNLIIARDIEVYSMCEHHMLPFFGRCHIGYIARNKLIGISKIARIVELYARRLQIQERLTSQIAHEMMDKLDALGVGVIMECSHLCMMMRGVEKQNSVMTTSTVLGTFRSDEATRLEFLTLVGKHRA